MFQPNTPINKSDVGLSNVDNLSISQIEEMITSDVLPPNWKSINGYYRNLVASYDPTNPPKRIKINFLLKVLDTSNPSNTQYRCEKAYMEFSVSNLPSNSNLWNYTLVLNQYTQYDTVYFPTTNVSSGVFRAGAVWYHGVVDPNCYGNVYILIQLSSAFNGLSDDVIVTDIFYNIESDPAISIFNTPIQETNAFINSLHSGMSSENIGGTTDTSFNPRSHGDISYTFITGGIFVDGQTAGGTRMLKSAFNKEFGTGSSTVCQGNDTRLDSTYVVFDVNNPVAVYQILSNNTYQALIAAKPDQISFRNLSAASWSVADNAYSITTTSASQLGVYRVRCQMYMTLNNSSSPAAGIYSVSGAGLILEAPIRFKLASFVNCNYAPSYYSGSYDNNIVGFTSIPLVNTTPSIPPNRSGLLYSFEFKIIISTIGVSEFQLQFLINTANITSLSSITTPYLTVCGGSRVIVERI